MTNIQITSDEPVNITLNGQPILTAPRTEDRLIQEPAVEYFSNGLSKKVITIPSPLDNDLLIQVHQFKALEDIRNLLLQGDKYHRQIGNVLPKYVLVGSPDYLQYSPETAYQIFRNQQAYWNHDPTIFDAFAYGPYFVNAETGEKTKEPKGYNPFDDWEIIRNPLTSRMSSVGVLAGGNNSRVYMPPWTVNTPPVQKFERFLKEAAERYRLQCFDRAETLRSLAGDSNPLEG